MELRQALRALRRSPGISLVVVATVAVGIAARPDPTATLRAQ